MSEEISSDIKIKTENLEAECSKPKKRRRGKKKRNKSHDNNKTMMEFDETKNSQINKNGESKKRPKLLIRPVDVPKAPENSTQFIIDDHDECHLYFSFETPNPYDDKNEEEGRSSDTFNDAACQDIDYEYHSMQDVDNTAYYLQDFELSYSKVRYEETMRLTKPDLVTALESLEARVRELEHKMYEKDPGSALEQLQRKLLRLQEENITLREEQQHLRKSIGADSASDLLQNSESEHSEQNSDMEEDLSDELISESSNDAFSPPRLPFDYEEEIMNEDDSEPDSDYEDYINASEDETVPSESSVVYGLYANNGSDNESEHCADELQEEEIANKNEACNSIDSHSKLSNSSFDDNIRSEFHNKTEVSEPSIDHLSETINKAHIQSTTVEHLSQNVEQLPESNNTDCFLNSDHVPTSEIVINQQPSEFVNTERSFKSVKSELPESVLLPECRNDLISMNNENP